MAIFKWLLVHNAKKYLSQIFKNTCCQSKASENLGGLKVNFMQMIRVTYFYTLSS